MFASHAQLITVGHSYEGREILGLRIGTRPTNNEFPHAPRKTILVIGGSHAREWISVSTANFIAYQLMTRYGKKSNITHLVDAFDWVFIPIVNPDGYEYTWTTDRLWRKNRQPTSLPFCKGIDIDRSFGFHFDSGTDGNPCSESYAGRNPWDAVEAGQLREWARNQTESGTQFVTFLDLHSYSQQILYPYSYTCEYYPPAWENLAELAFGLAKAMRLSHGHSIYQTARACEGNVAVNSEGASCSIGRLETAGGSALDWFYSELQVKFSYQIKLRDTGGYGFLIPPDQIIPTGKEVFSAIEYLGKFLLGEIGMNDATEMLGTSGNDDDSPGEVGSTQDEEQRFDEKDSQLQPQPPPPLTKQPAMKLEFRRRR